MGKEARDSAGGADDKRPDSDDVPRAYATLADEVTGLIKGAKAAAASEIAYQKARAGLAAGTIARIAGFGLLAIALLFFVLMALVVGLLLALLGPLGAWGATGAVVVGLLLAAALALLGVRAGVRRLIRLIAGGDD